MKVKDVRKALKNFRPDEEVLVMDLEGVLCCALENIMKRTCNSDAQAIIIINSNQEANLL